MLKRIVLFFLLMLVISVGVAQAQDTEFLGIDGTTYTPGSYITVRWRVTNVDLAILEIYDAAHPDVLVNMEFLSTEGVRDVYLPPTLTRGARFVLWSANNPSFDHAPQYVAIYKRLRSQTLVLTSTVSAPVVSAPSDAPACQPTFYFPGKDESNCLPMLQARVGATYQPFENGFMLWRRDTGDVWVMEKTGLSLDYFEPVYGLMADNPIGLTPPTGRSSPANGFGRVWGNVDDVRQALGWALGPEVGYVMTVQYTLDSSQVPYSFMTLPNDTVVKVFDGGRWMVETP